MGFFFPMKPSEFRNFLSVESSNKQTTENCGNFYDTKNHIPSKLIDINFNY